ncbi:MAG: hypothetical protein J6X08_03880 [Lachnospiraceae bacterium]|nr:hypothetical protein [Lachnospiraceae bacterium]
MNRKNRLAFIILAVTAIAALGVGLIFKPALAKEPKVKSSGDRLIGVFVTKDYVDTFNMEAYINDNPDILVSRETTVSLEDSSKYNNRIYAVKTNPDGENHDYYFEGFEGIRCFTVSLNTPRPVPDSPTGEIDEDYVTHISISDAECSSSRHYDDSNSEPGTYNPHFCESELNCFIYAFPTGDGSALGMYCNPVYQDKDGQVYMTGGQCIAAANDESSIGMTLKSTMTEKYEETSSSGESSEETITVNAELKIVSPTINYVFSQYDSEGKLINNESFTSKDMPSEIKLLRDCNYAVVTETTKNGKAKRTLIDKENTRFFYYVASESIFADSKTCEFIWP